MIVDRRILTCVVLSIVAHVGFARAMRGLPKHVDGPVKRTISIRVVAPPPPLEPPPEPANLQPLATPKPVPVERAKARRAPQVAEQAAPRDVPPPEHPPAPGATGGRPVFGMSMDSMSQGGSGSSMPVGNTGSPGEAHGGDGDEGESKGHGAQPIPVYEVTTMPLPQGRCAGKYTDEAKQAAIEGTVVLDLVVGADGRVREVHVISGLGYGLTAAAVAAAKACRFSPGQKGDLPVPVRIREFKIRFLLQNDE